MLEVDYEKNEYGNAIKYLQLGNQIDSSKF